MSEKYCLGCGVNLNLAEHEYCGFCKPRYVHTGETMANDLVLFKTVETSLRRQIKELRSDNKALMEALEGILESYDLVVDEERLSPGIKDMFKGFFQNEPEKARKAIAEAIQAEPPTYGINPVKDGVLRFKNPDGTAIQGEPG